MDSQLTRDPQSTAPYNPELQVLIETLFTRISEISTLPHLAVQIMKTADDPTTSGEDLLELVRSDPALAMRLMRTVNSSYYGLDAKVADLKQAVVLLGFKEVRNLAMTSYVAQLFRDSEGHGSFSRRGLWVHMVATGLVSRLIARISGKVSPEEAYLAGMLHDVGLVLIDQHLHQRFCRIVDELTPETPICELEQQVLGFDHAALGEFIGIRWQLPAHLTAGMGYHHKPQRYAGPHRMMVYTVALANFLCHLKKLPSLGVSSNRSLSPEFFNELGLMKPQVTTLLEQLDVVLRAANELATAGVR